MLRARLLGRRVGSTRALGRVPRARTERALVEITLDNLEECIARLRRAKPEERAIALDGLAFVAGRVMDDAAQEWESIVGREWERYVD